MEGSITVSTRTLARAAAFIVLAAAIVFLVALAWQERGRLGLGGDLASQADGSTYQAVFLVGGQAYFGKLSSAGGGNYLMTDVYYIPPDLPGASPRPAGTLIRRTTEVHRPRDGMVIPAGSILFMENLSAESEIVQAINRFKSGASQPVPAATSAPTRSPSPAPATARPSASAAR